MGLARWIRQAGGMAQLRVVSATRYVEPLREGGSLPGLVEASDEGLYVVKLTGAGQGPAVLAAEVVVGELARALGLRVPELVRIQVDWELSRAEPDPEIQELLAASAGINLGVDFLPGALPFTAAAAARTGAETAAEIVWLDALTMNVDRTPRNPNLLVWHEQTWLIDHGAALYRQHGATPLSESAGDTFPHISEHVLLPVAGSIRMAHMRLAARAHAAVGPAVDLVPEDWLGPNPEVKRQDIVKFLTTRLGLDGPDPAFITEAEVSRRAVIAPTRHLPEGHFKREMSDAGG
jgi:hypothetical protein